MDNYKLKYASIRKKIFNATENERDFAFTGCNFTPEDSRAKSGLNHQIYHQQNGNAFW